MIKLYITDGSPYARMARIVVLEKGLSDRVEVIVAKTRTADSPYYQINPSGGVPYLVREDGVGMEEREVRCRETPPRFVDRVRPLQPGDGSKRRLAARRDDVDQAVELECQLALAGWDRDRDRLDQPA